jgi:hypothetical protein
MDINDPASQSQLPWHELPDGTLVVLNDVQAVGPKAPASGMYWWCVVGGQSLNVRQPSVMHDAAYEQARQDLLTALRRWLT